MKASVCIGSVAFCANLLIIASLALLKPILAKTIHFVHDFWHVFQCHGILFIISCTVRFFQLFWNSLNYALMPSLAHNETFIITIHHIEFFSAVLLLLSDMIRTPFCNGAQSLKPYYHNETALVRVLRRAQRRAYVMYFD